MAVYMWFLAATKPDLERFGDQGFDDLKCDIGKKRILVKMQTPFMGVDDFIDIYSSLSNNRGFFDPSGAFCLP